MTTCVDIDKKQFNLRSAMQYLSKITFFIFLIFTLSCSNLKIENPKFEKLNQFLETVSTHKKAIGTVLILEKGKIIYNKTYSFKEMPTSPIYRIGSISKTYTAVIIAKLVEDKMLKYNDVLSTYFPTIQNAKKITIEQLLQHRSGLVNFTDTKDYMSYAESPATEQQHITRIVKNGTNFKPNQKHEYSNTGYVLLSLIAEKASGKSYSMLLDQYIVTPLKLKNTYVFNADERKRNEVISFEKRENWAPSTNTHQSVPLGAGSIAANAEEVAIFFHALFNNKLVNKKSLEKMTKMNEGYGHALFQIPYGKKIGLGHNGRIDGFSSIAAYFPDSNIVFIQISNASSMNMNDISLATLASFYGDKFELPKFKIIKTISSRILQAYVGKFVAKDFPLAIKISIKNGNLYGQADGQSAFPLEAYSKTEFSFPSANIDIVFKKDGTSFDFFQGKHFTFNKVE
ncbi:MAG: beta-lactamase family protein [Bacteriovoracaceae bacterium]|nr:beta-lactamase family protein [Bacteriovoracaceae bacterium]